MDRPRRRPGVLIGAAGLLLVAAGPAAPPLRAMRWLAPGADAARILTRQPPECLRAPADADTAYSVELGRAAFRSPLLLGGQAARAGVACETCHRNGRTNPDFDFPGVSGAPGTADVTDSLFSSHRGDGIDNPKPIPDLGGPKAALKVSQSAPGALEGFIHGLVTEEFDGAEPPPAVLQGLADYVRAMDPAVCASKGPEPVTSSAGVDGARRAVRAALAALGRNDPATARVMTVAARAQLGLIAERYPGAALAGDAGAIAGSARDLQLADDRIRSGESAHARSLLLAWLVDSLALQAALRADEPRSLYTPSAWPGAAAR
ncbi:hypothetical protein ACO2Q3_08970 [Caulobacter sp. KR2-114]|uniref:hypothetical protein n=1 Tax=Caulobacter sp. KR2-114 TaxID=3400912 RepID=UPI003BFDE3C1